MDKYSHWFGKFVGRLNSQEHYAITLGQTTYYSCDEKYVGDAWRAEEDFHKQQWRRDGWKFLPKYLWYKIRYGYDKNPYEIEAKKAAGRL